MSQSMQKQSAYTRELFAITEVVAKFRHYMIGQQFIIKTDQQAIRHLCTQIIQTPEQQKWLPKLLRFNFIIEYKPGVENKVADALSRCFQLSYSSPDCHLLYQIKQAQTKDPIFREIIQQL